MGWGMVGPQGCFTGRSGESIPSPRGGASIPVLDNLISLTTKTDQADKCRSGIDYTDLFVQVLLTISEYCSLWNLSVTIFEFETWEGNGNNQTPNNDKQFLMYNSKLHEKENHHNR